MLHNQGQNNKVPPKKDFTFSNSTQALKYWQFLTIHYALKFATQDKYPEIVCNKIARHLKT